jgi:type IV pilus assembly protein PilC
MLLLENIELYISSGLTLAEAVKTSSQSFSPRQCKSLKEILTSIEQGKLFSDSLKKHIGLPETLSSLIEQGEQAGSLPRSLVLARTMIEREDTLIKTCVSALTYPVVIGVFAVLLTVGLMKGVMPQIIPLLMSLRVDLPLITRVIIYLSEHMVIFTLYFLGSGLFLIPLFYFVIRKSLRFKRFIHGTFSFVPIVGNVYKQFQLSLLIRSLGSLIIGGISIENAYTRVVEKIGFLNLRDYFYDKSELVTQGVLLSNIFSGFKGVPKHITPLISAGEASGNLGESLIRASEIIDRDIENSLKRITSLIEPVMMMCIGLMIGAIALSIMIPIYDVSKVLQH